ncbi:phosphonate metabolism transcriptional regulator PhnF [Azorhizobium oxalatiphilum]|uniref:Phosphonate metabolism transcriptional regulator PhnF n=2 Tax=Azorhizobium oxalatiphilum TaxID=980631 RepID=A0A917F4G5_9HYPH|nr:phosphonate metabolism transcriptional regulator PhnF [Azorhizobium oxalatiphilum]
MDEVDHGPMTAGETADARSESVKPEDVKRGSGVSLWKQIAETLEAEIASGARKPGARLPVEAELAERFGVNRHTVRRALSVLGERGLIEATAGRGTFVKEPPLRYPIGARTRFSEIVLASGREPHGRFLGSQVEDASVEVARELGVAPGTKVLRIDTTHEADGVPISCGSAWFVHARCQDLDLVYAATGSLTRALSTLGIIDFRRKETRLTARVADERERGLLSLAMGRSVMVVERVDVDVAGVPLQWGRSSFAADRVQLVIKP